MTIPKADRDLGKAHSLLRDRIESLIAFMELIGHPIFVTECWRSRDRQSALYAQGRTAPGLIVTNAQPGTSKHEYMHDNAPCALAVDVAFDCAHTLTKDPWSEDHPWGVLIMAGKELYKLHSITKWAELNQKFIGDRPHFEISI